MGRGDAGGGFMYWGPRGVMLAVLHIVQSGNATYIAETVDGSLGTRPAPDAIAVIRLGSAANPW